MFPSSRCLPRMPSGLQSSPPANSYGQFCSSGVRYIICVAMSGANEAVSYVNGFIQNETTSYVGSRHGTCLAPCGVFYFLGIDSKIVFTVLTKIHTFPTCCTLYFVPGESTLCAQCLLHYQFRTIVLTWFSYFVLSCALIITTFALSYILQLCIIQCALIMQQTHIIA